MSVQNIDLMPKVKSTHTRLSGKTIEDAKLLLKRGSVTLSDLLYFGVDVLKKLCEAKGLSVASSGWLGCPIKQDYVKALHEHVSVACID
jgi:hypothetical protein